MASISFRFLDDVLDFDCFCVEAYRSEDGESLLALLGSSCSLDMYLTFRNFHISRCDEVLDLCDMLNYILELISSGASEKSALSHAAGLYPDVFKYLAVFGYESPSEEGGVADA